VIVGALWDAFKAAIGSAARNAGDVTGTVRDFNQTREDEKDLREREQRFETQVVRAYVEGMNRHMNRGQRQEQYKDDDVRVTVRSGWSADHQCVTTDVTVAPRIKGDGGHLHVVFSDTGEIIYRGWNKH